MDKQPLMESETVELKYAPDAVFREIGNLFIVSFPRPSFFEQEEAIQLVMEQAERLSDDWSRDDYTIHMILDQE